MTGFLIFTVALSAFTAVVFKLLSFIKSGLTFKKFLLLEIPLAVLALTVTFRIEASYNRTDAFNYSYFAAGFLGNSSDLLGEIGNPLLTPSLIEGGYGEYHSYLLDPAMPFFEGTMYFKKENTYYIHNPFSLYSIVSPKDLTPMDDVLNGEEFIPLYAAN